MAEAVCSCPQEAFFQEASTKLADLLTSKAGATKLQKFLDEWTKLRDKPEDEDMIKNAVADLQQA
eukprot:788697-Amphidinium_carterae.1